MKQSPFISIVVPVLNREDHIARCLDSLMELDYPSFEIIVVDNGSTDRTREIVSQYPVKMIVEKRLGSYSARNKGIETGQGKIIAFTDSDCIVDRSWLTNLVQGYSEDAVGAVGGQVLPYETEGLIDQFLSLGPLQVFHSNKTVTVERKRNRFLSGGLGSGNMSFRSNVLDEVNGFSTDLTVCGDYDLSWTVQRAGYQIIYEPKAIVYHKLRTTLPQLVRQFFGLGESEPHLLKMQPEGFSYIGIKTYILPNYEFRCKLPVQTLLNIDFLNLATLGLFLAVVYPRLLYVLGTIFLVACWQTWRKTREIVNKTQSIRWFLLFPMLNIIRIYSYTLGRVVGGIRHKVVSV